MDATALDTYLVNIEAEQAVLGAILVEPDLIKDCILQPEHFGVPEHKNLFYVMRELDEKGKPIDPITIIERVGNAKVDKIGGVSYLSKLAESVPTTANFKYYESVVVEYYQRRKVYDIAREIMQKAPEQDPEKLIHEAIDQLTSLGDTKADEDNGSIKEDLVELYAEMEIDKGDITGIPTGFIEFDRMTSGLQRQDLIIVGARPSVGKTAFAINIGLNAADHNKRPRGQLGDVVGIFSLEMSKKQLLKRMISNIGNIDASRMRNPRRYFEPEDWNKLNMAMGIISNMDLEIYDKPGVTVHEIYRQCRKLRRQYPDRNILIIIDYLQLIVGNPKYKGNRTQEIGEISRTLKVMARDLDLTVIALSQLSRAVEQRQDKRPMMSDLRESGQIEQDADVIAFLYRDDYYDKESENKNIIEIIVAKQRNGPVGNVQLAFIKEYNKFVNLERRFDQ
jgi:replicative DNA helicase